MKFAAVLNRGGGTLKTTDLSAFCDRMRETLEAAGHSVVIDVVEGDEIAAALDKAVATRGIDVVLAGGGDGTISAAAARLMGKKKALAILPAGTMNLFARGLGIPQSLDGAVQAFAEGEVVAVDMASANGQPFVHQFSIGMHAKMVQLREKMDFGSRLGKMSASARAAWTTINNPPAMSVTLTIGEAEIMTRTSGIGITNNLFGERHLPYADDPAGGTLGIYVTMARQRGELLHHFFNVARGRWRDNQHVEIHQTDKAVLEISSSARRLRAVLDGELIKLEPKTVFEIHPKALKVLVPAIREPKAA
jgi:diacylglycerol kinase family enzyme